MNTEKTWFNLRDYMWKYIGTFFADTPLIIQAGSHKGEVCIDIFSKYYSEAEIHTFEPCHDSYITCKNNIENSSVKQNIKLYNFGLSNTPGNAVLNISTSSNTNSIYNINNIYSVTHPHTNKKETIKLITLDYFYKDILKENGRPIDLLYLNTEGHELEILRGSLEILGNTKVVFLEVNFIEIWKDSPVFKDIDIFMQNNGFFLSLHDKRPDYSWTSIQCGAVYVNKNTIYT